MKTRLVWVAVAIAVPALVLLLVACGHAVGDAGSGQKQAGESPSWQTTLTQSKPRAAAAGDPTFTVTNTNDSDAGSLRQAILDSNGMTDAGANTITFAIPSGDPNCTDAGVCTIAPASALPTVTQPVTIDGYSQSGAAQATDAGTATLTVVLNGANAGTADGGTVDGLTIAAGSSTVQGLVINGFSGNGIVLETNGSNTIAGNYVGTDVTGSIAVRNSGAGVLVDGVASNTIGGTGASARNVLSGNQVGVLLELSGATGNVVAGNYVGTDATGSSAIPNDLNGVQVSGAPSNTIGEGNV